MGRPDLDGRTCGGCYFFDQSDVRVFEVGDAGELQLFGSCFGVPPLGRLHRITGLSSPTTRFNLAEQPHVNEHRRACAAFESVDLPSTTIEPPDANRLLEPSLVFEAMEPVNDGDPVNPAGEYS